MKREVKHSLCPFYASLGEQLEYIRDDQDKLKIFEAVFNYGIYGEEPGDVPDIVKLVFLGIKPSIDRYYACTDGGKKGGRPRRVKSDPETETGSDPEEDHPETEKNEEEKPKVKPKDKPKVYNSFSDKMEEETKKEKPKVKPKGKRVLSNETETETETETEKETETETETETESAPLSASVPSLSEVENFFNENGYTSNAFRFWEYYNRREWKNVKGKPINWKLKAGDWEARENENGSSSGEMIIPMPDYMRT